jgi:tight adherence protein C
MGEFVTTVMGPEFLVTLLAAICAFASILTFGLPLLERDRVNQRMRVMAVERDKLRAQRMQEMSVQERQGAGGSGRLRQAPKGFVRQLVDALNLKEKFDSEELRNKLKAAGFRSENHLLTFMAFRVILPPAMFLFGLLYMFVIGNFEMAPMMKFLIAAGIGFLGFYVPNIFIENKTQKRRVSVEQAFPDALDMLLICVQSGMSVEASFGKVAREVTVQSMELAEELSLTTAELSYLPDRRTVGPPTRTSPSGPVWRA